MNSRELIRAVLKFEDPPRIGMFLPKPYVNDHISHGRTAPPDQERKPQAGERRRWRDEWGNVWATLTRYDKGEVVVGAIEDWSQLDGYQPPDLGRPEDYRSAAEAFAADRSHFRMGNIQGCTFNVARYIRKLENYLCDLLVKRPRIDRLHAVVRAELLKSVDCWAKAGADGIFFPEDWGTQQGLMVSPAMWREIFKPDPHRLRTDTRARHERLDALVRPDDRHHSGPDRMRGERASVPTSSACMGSNAWANNSAARSRSWARWISSARSRRETES